MCGCGRTSSPLPGSSATGPIWSKKTKGPTLRRSLAGRARRTMKPSPRSRTIGTCTASIMVAMYRIDHHAAHRAAGRCHPCHPARHRAGLPADRGRHPPQRADQPAGTRGRPATRAGGGAAVPGGDGGRPGAPRARLRGAPGAAHLHGGLSRGGDSAPHLPADCARLPRRPHRGRPCAAGRDPLHDCHAGAHRQPCALHARGLPRREYRALLHPLMARLRHIAITVPDPEKAAAFYERALGLKRVGTTDWEGARGIYLSDGVMNLALLHYKEERYAGKLGASHVGVHHFGFVVEDLASTRAAIEAAGGGHWMGEPAEGGGFYQVEYFDTDGIAFDVTAHGWTGASKT